MCASLYYARFVRRPRVFTASLSLFCQCRLCPSGTKPGWSLCAPAECCHCCVLFNSLAKRPGPVSDLPRRFIPPLFPRQYTGFTARPWAFGPEASPRFALRPTS